MEKSFTQESHVYLIISDLHDFYKNKAARFDYVSEIEFVKRKIESLVVSYKHQGFKVYLMFLGDIFDRSYKNVTEALRAQSYYTNLADQVEAIYTVVGNHEYTYAANNPFWSLVASIETERVSNHANRVWDCYGFKPVFKVVDRVVDGNVEFCFNHYGAYILPPDPSKLTIGLFHQDVVFNGILEEAKRNNRTLFEMENRELRKFFPVVTLDSNMGKLSGYDYSFFGHLHLLYGDWKYTDDSTGKVTNILWYLASLGRTNHREVQDSFLERSIPAVIVTNGNLERVVNNVFNLPSRQESVEEVVVEENQQKYEVVKQRKELRSYVGTSDDPVASLVSHFLTQEGQNGISGMIIDSILQDSPDEFLQVLRSDYNKIL